jgi:hypothetical protein
VDGDCAKRRTACNWFRYGNCNHDRDCSGPVVCRVSKCTPPWELYQCNQNSEYAIQTACHRALCSGSQC